MTERVKTIIDWLIARLSENSTWRGIIAFAAACGATIEEQHAAQIIAAGLALIGVINMFRSGAPTKAQVAEALATKQDKP